MKGIFSSRDVSEVGGSIEPTLNAVRKKRNGSVAAVAPPLIVSVCGMWTLWIGQKVGVHHHTTQRESSTAPSSSPSFRGELYRGYCVTTK
jgi:hypothetical protein